MEIAVTRECYTNLCMTITDNRQGYIMSLSDERNMYYGTGYDVMAVADSDGIYVTFSYYENGRYFPADNVTYKLSEIPVVEYRHSMFTDDDTKYYSIVLDTIL